MAVARQLDAYVALTRFGLGPRRGEAAGIASDPRGFLLAQLQQPKSTKIAGDFPSARTVLSAIASYKQKRRHAVLPTNATKAPFADNYQADVLARASAAVTTDSAFVERLAMFWSNFFAVSADKGVTMRASVGAFEREAIRPYVLGRFVDMLMAATKHPTMLTYLDNNKSVGPHSARGRGDDGLNENLARETLELHSLGVDGGYTQADVTSLARVITGWGALEKQYYGSFHFDASAHEPGNFTVLGRKYGQPGVKQGEAVLADLARHPSTAGHVAKRLAQYFLSETPPPGIVQRLAQTFRKTDGDLKEVAAALATADEAWTWPQVKFLPPYDYAVAVHRATATMPAMPEFHRITATLGQATWTPGSPKGWSDEDNVWAAPDALVARADWASELADRAGTQTDVGALADDLIGPRLQTFTREAITHAATRGQGLALLLASAEFQLR